MSSVSAAGPAPVDRVALRQEQYKKETREDDVKDKNLTRDLEKVDQEINVVKEDDLSEQLTKSLRFAENKADDKADRQNYEAARRGARLNIEA